MTLSTQSGIQHLFDDNQAALDRVAFQLRQATLLEASFDNLRSELSGLAAERPHYCLMMCAALLNALRELSKEFAGERRAVIAFFMEKSLNNLELLEPKPAMR
ncbi:hypothetical protein ACROAK_09470 [Shewanella oncorhynchi]|uniref:hypothetical protein n=1 Tax=Shewanella oncorhynchi TaxID=2726434 RepID=UPI00324FFBE2